MNKINSAGVMKFTDEQYSRQDEWKDAQFSYLIILGKNKFFLILKS